MTRIFFVYIDWTTESLPPDRITCALLAKEYGVTIGNIGSIITQRTWK